MRIHAELTTQKRLITNSINKDKAVVRGGRQLFCVYNYFPFIALIICITAAFCSVLRFTQPSNNSFNSGVISTISPSAKNCDKVIPNPLQIACKVLMEGTVFRLNTLAKVVCDNPDNSDILYVVRPRSSNICLNLSLTSIPLSPSLVILY